MSRPALDAGGRAADEVIAMLLDALLEFRTSAGHRAMALPDFAGHCRYTDHDPVRVKHGAGFRVEFGRQEWHCGPKCQALTEAIEAARGYLAENAAPEIRQLELVS